MGDSDEPPPLVRRSSGNEPRMGLSPPISERGRVDRGNDLDGLLSPGYAPKTATAYRRESESERARPLPAKNVRRPELGLRSAIIELEQLRAQTSGAFRSALTHKLGMNLETGVGLDGDLDRL